MNKIKILATSRIQIISALMFLIVTGLFWNGFSSLHDNNPSYLKALFPLAIKKVALPNHQ